MMYVVSSLYFAVQWAFPLCACSNYCKHVMFAGVISL